MAGAVDVATYFVELYPYLFATGDVTQWEQLSAPDCVFCHDVIEDADALVAQGQRREGGTVSVGYAVGAEIGEASSYSVDLTMDEAPARVIDSDGTEVDAWSVAQSYRTGVVLLHDGAAWSIRAVEPVPVNP
ncbi:hypothetical protein ASD18_03820 [Cellulomonas sp. Root137]|nr:hypothetical protein ASD18_03820 [Cellulomonas sp. Root137]